MCRDVSELLSASTVKLNDSGIYFNIIIKYICQRRAWHPLRPPQPPPASQRQQCSTRLNDKMALTGASAWQEILQLYSDKYHYT